MRTKPLQLPSFRSSRKREGLVLAGTGHRPSKLGNVDMQRFRSELLEVILRLRPSVIISGMALGFDTLLAQTALDYDYPLVCAVPFRGWDKLWSDEDRVEAARILSAASKVVWTSKGMPEGTSLEKLYDHRNRWMVDHCHILIEGWNGSPGGTMNCVYYAQHVGCPSVRIDPDKFRVAA